MSGSAKLTRDYDESPHHPQKKAATIGSDPGKLSFKQPIKAYLPFSSNTFTGSVG
jgi:hypothetical protein